MNAVRIGLAALVITVFAGLENRAEAGTWSVRVEVQHVVTGYTYYPTIFSSTDKKEAWSEYAFYEMLLKLYPRTFRDHVLTDTLGVPAYYTPIRLHMVYLEGINPTGRQ